MLNFQEHEHLSQISYVSSAKNWEYCSNCVNKAQNMPNEDYYTPITKEDQNLTKFIENTNIVYNDLSNILLLL